MKLPHLSKKIIKWIPAYVVPLIVVLFVWNYFMIPQSMTFIEGHQFKCDTILPVSMSVSADGDSATVKAFGVVTQKIIDVNLIPETKVIVSGKPIGVKMVSEGLLVTGFVGFLAEDNVFVTPARDSDIRQGDRILKVDGKSIKNANDFSEILCQCKGYPVKLTVNRNGKEIEIMAKPCKDLEGGIYKLGLWVKDSVAGIGTLTFYSSKTGFYGALGHGITDSETGTVFNLSKGILMNADITGVVKGTSGVPGELKGVFLTGDKNVASGNVLLNNDEGIYGYLSKDAMEKLSGKEMLIGTASMVKEGPATIISTIDGEGPCEYSVNIQKVSLSKVGSTKGLVVKITDKKLLDKTGGIVQGMSGSPIIQNGRLIGAITHVMINDPTMGYGVFIESMLENRTETNYQSAA
ncbi:MAG: SpoIVB peptidase [Ruminococcaceae bacterium]|nr:SpoIVB peptidase [Oscillospiraceae bacterium]